MKSGIYIIKCLGNGRAYIGSSVNIKYRIQRHKRQLIDNRHGNKKMQAIFNKYGVDLFTFETLEFCERDQLLIREQHYLNTMVHAQEQDKFAIEAMNLSPTASSTLGSKRTTEQLLKYSILRKGRKPWNKGLTMGSQSDELIKKRFENRKNNGKQWHSEETKRKISLANLGKILPSPSIEVRIKRGNSIKGKNCKPVQQFDSCNDLVAEYISMEQVQEIFGCGGKLSQAISKQLIFKGFKWKYLKKGTVFSYKKIKEKPIPF